MLLNFDLQLRPVWKRLTETPIWENDQKKILSPLFLLLFENISWG